MHLVRFTRPSLGVQTPARGCELFFVPGVVCRSFFFRAAADVFCGRAASDETCECRARLTGGRDGCRRFARRPHNTPVRASCRLSRGICCAAPHGERCSATVHAVLVLFSARVRTAVVLRGCSGEAGTCWLRGVALACSTHPLLLFLGLLCCQRPRARLQSAPRATGAKVCLH